MTRREALLRLMAVAGGTVFGAHRFLAGEAFAEDTSPIVGLSAADLVLLGEVAETIVPATKDCGGAKEARVAEFMQDIATTFYDEPERDLLRSAPKFFDAQARATPGARTFLELNPSERFGLLLAMDRRNPQPEAYRMVKQLTLWGYWTSEVAAKQALIYLPVPGVYRGCVDVTPDTKAMF